MERNLAAADAAAIAFKAQHHMKVAMHLLCYAEGQVLLPKQFVDLENIKLKKKKNLIPFRRNPLHKLHKFGEADGIFDITIRVLNPFRPGDARAVRPRQLAHVPKRPAGGFLGIVELARLVVIVRLDVLPVLGRQGGDGIARVAYGLDDEVGAGKVLLEDFLLLALVVGDGFDVLADRALLEDFRF